MRKIKIHFTRNRKGKIFSKIIQWYEGLPVSHCAVEIYVRSIDTQTIYHSSMDSGVNFFNKPLFTEKNEIMETYELFLTEEQHRMLLKSLIDNCGESYAFLQNIGVFIVESLKLMGVSIKNPWKRGYNCSELLYREILPLLTKELQELDPELVKPSDIRNLLKSNGYVPKFSKITTI